MKTEFIWYNPTEKEYQFGDKQEYLDVIKKSNQSRNFVILDKLPNLDAAFRSKMISKLKFLNNIRKTGMMEFI